MMTVELLCLQVTHQVDAHHPPDYVGVCFDLMQYKFCSAYRSLYLLGLLLLGFFNRRELASSCLQFRII